MKRCLIVPTGWPCTLGDCPPGPFIFDSRLCFKSEYITENKCDAYCASGEYFCGPPPQTDESRSACMVQPVHIEWSDGE